MTTPSASLPAVAGRPAASRRGAARWLCCSVLAAAAAASALAQPQLPGVVVWDFDDQTAVATQPPQRTAFLKRALSENITATLLQLPGLAVVERQRLKDVLAEQQLTSSNLADDDARLRLGRILGASRMVFGGFFVLGNSVQVHLRLVDTATTRVLFADETTATLDGVMQQVQPLNQRLARALGAAPAATGAAKAAESAAGSDAIVWQAYDRALALADAGDIDGAVTALQDLLARHKNFTPAERQLLALLEKMARR